jgi:GntR family transcriptional regulator
MTKYAKIAADLETKIRQKKLTERLPNERDLCQQYGVSRNTINQALNILEQKNLVYRRHGSGTYIRDVINVADHNVSIHLFTDGFQRSAEAENRQVKTEIIEFKPAFAPKKITDQLQVSDQTPLYEVTRLRYNNNQPACYERNIIPINLLPDLTRDDMTGSLFAYAAKQLDLKVSNAAVEVTAPLADDTIRTALKLPADVPPVVVRSEGTAFLENGKPLEFFDTYYRPEFFNLKANAN